MTKAVGIQPCGGCTDRQRKLNRWLPSRKAVVDCLILIPGKLEQQWMPARGTKMAELLEGRGMSSHVQPLHHVNLEGVDELVELRRPRLLINHAMLLNPAHVAHLLDRFADLTVITVNHSSWSDLVRVSRWLRHQAVYIDQAQRHPRAWYAAVDERRWLEKLTLRHCIWLPNPIVIPPELPASQLHDPPTVGLSCRFDMVKNIPNTLLGVKLADGFKSLLSFATDAREQVDSLAAVMRLDYDVQDWLPWQEHIERVGRDIDIGLQVSFTESMNYVALEMMLLGKPVVGSKAIRYLPPSWQASADDPDDIARRLTFVRNNYEAQAIRARPLALAYADNNNTQFMVQIEKVI
jgi:glycosyltransferase involved in cell wall biosynthesis